MAYTSDQKFHAFLSYSHADVRWAKWLHRSIERFQIAKDLQGRITQRGPVPNTLHPIFRDRDDFTTGHTLTEQTIEALDQSRSLILLCSPSVARSHNVNEEVRLFRWRHPDRLVIPVIINGKPGDPEQECFPRSLVAAVAADGSLTAELEAAPLAADLRDKADGKELGLAKIVSGLIGIPLDEVVRRAEREKRRQLRKWIIGLTVICAVMFILAAWAEVNRREAVEQRRVTQETLDRTSQLSNAMVGEWAERLQDQEHIPQALVIEILKKAQALVDGLSERGAANPQVQRALAVAIVELSSKLLSQRRISEAKDEILRAVAIFDRLLQGSPSDPERISDLIAALDRLGDVYAASGDVEVARNTRERSLGLARSLSAGDHAPLAYKKLLAVSLEKVADLLQAENLAHALDYYRQSLSLRRSIAADEPISAQSKRDVAVSLDRVASCLRQLGRSEEAISSWQESLAVSIEASVLAPTNTQLRREVGVAHQRIGDIYKSDGNMPAALASYQSDLDIIKVLIAQDGTRIGWGYDSLNSYVRVGNAQAAIGDLISATATFKEGLAQALVIVDEPQDSPDWRTVAAFQQLISRTLSVRREHAQALSIAASAAAYFRAVAERHPDQRKRLSETLNNQSWYALLAGTYFEALSAAEASISLAPETADFRVNYFHALALSGATSAKDYFQHSKLLKLGDGETVETQVHRDIDVMRSRGISEIELSKILAATESPNAP